MTAITTLTDNLMELADAFGVWASLFVLERKGEQLVWRNGRFVERNTISGKELMITLITPDQRVGQAITEDLSQHSLHQVFHRARHTCAANPQLLAFLQQLSVQGDRTPPLTTKSDEHDWVNKSFYFPLEEQHRQFTNISPLESTVRVSRDDLTIARSDGTFLQTSLWRTLYHLLVRKNGSGQSSWRTGLVGHEQRDLSPDWLVSDIEAQLHSSLTWNQLPHNQSTFVEQERTSSALSNLSSLIIDGEIVTHLIEELVQSTPHITPSSSHLSLWTDQVETVHPVGYITPVVQLLSSAGWNHAHFSRLRAARLPLHMTLRLPLLWEESTELPEIYPHLNTHGYHSERIGFAAEGVELCQFHERTASFCIKPKNLYQWAPDKGLTKLSSRTFHCSLELLLRSIIGGIGPVKTFWTDNEWSLTAPRFIFLRFPDSACEEDLS